MDRESQLISLLLDGDARWDERDDAASDLGTFDSHATQRALANIAADEEIDDVLRQTTSESLADIWVRNGYVDAALYSSLTTVGKEQVRSVVDAQAPDLTSSLES